MKSDSVLMDYGDYEIMLPPCTYCPSHEWVRYVFAVPKDNTVGTNEMDNAITLLEFKNNEELETHIVKKDFMEMVTGPFEFRFLPVWSDKEIAYSQTKGVLLINLAEKKVEIHSICPGLYDGEIEKLSVLDAKQRTLAIELIRMSEGETWKKTIRLIRFENDTFTALGELSAGLKTSAYTEPWFVYAKKVFVYKDSATKLEVFDEQLKPTSHPLAEAFNRNQVGFRCMQEIAVHPTLPFALVIEQGKWPTKEQLSKFDSLTGTALDTATDVLYNEANRLTLYIFRWMHPDPKQRFIPLLSVAGSIWQSYNPKNAYSDFTFSPDGKWVVFRDKSYDSNNPVFVAVPIDEKNPLYLGKPVKLGNAMRTGATGPQSTAWTTKPTAFVMSDGLALYRWVLGDYKKYSMHKVKMPLTAPDPLIKKQE